MFPFQTDTQVYGFGFCAFFVLPVAVTLVTRDTRKGDWAAMLMAFWTLCYTLGALVGIKLGV